MELTCFLSCVFSVSLHFLECTSAFVFFLQSSQKASLQGHAKVRIYFQKRFESALSQEVPCSLPPVRASVWTVNWIWKPAQVKVIWLKNTGWFWPRSGHWSASLCRCVKAQWRRQGRGWVWAAGKKREHFFQQAWLVVALVHHWFKLLKSKSQFNPFRRWQSQSLFLGFLHCSLCVRVCLQPLF